MIYKTLLKKVADGQIEIIAWKGTGCYGTQHVDTIFYQNGSDRPRRKILEITKVPADLKR